jgi:hypothetical protein
MTILLSRIWPTTVKASDTLSDSERMSEARRHHFLSQCYLKGFTDDGTKDGRLFVINVADGSTFGTKPINVAVERDFNAVEGRPPGEIEGELAKLEGHLSAALDRVVQARSIDNNNDWQAVLNLIALFAVRNPRMRNALGEFIADISDKIMSLSLATEERWNSQVARMKAAGAYDDERPEMTYADIKSFHDSGEHRIKVSRGYRIRLELTAVEPVLKALVSRNWMLLVSEAGEFITTDHPICLTDRNGELPSFQKPVGHRTKGSTVILPISRHLLAIGTFGGNTEVLHPTKAQVAVTNSTIVQFAEKQIYAANQQFPIFVSGMALPITGSELATKLAESAKTVKP